MVHRGGLETSSEKNKKDDFNICIAEDAKTADDEIYSDRKIEELTSKAKQVKRSIKKSSPKTTALPLSDHSISQSVVRVERSRFIKKKNNNNPNSKPDTSVKSTRLSPVRAGLRSNSLESHTSTTSNNNNAKAKKKKVNSKKANANANAKPIDSPPEEAKEENEVSDDSKNPQQKLSQQLPLTIICSLPLDRLSGILDNLKIDKTSTKPLASAEDDTSPEDKANVDQNSSQCKILCLYCDKRMSTVKFRARHIERFHTISKERRSSGRNPITASDPAGSLPICSSSSAASSTPKSSSSSILFSGCSFCSKSPKLQAVALENDLSALFYHLVDLHSDKYFGCKLCAIRFQNAAKLGDHVQRTHTQSSKSTNPLGDVSLSLATEEERTLSEFGKSTPTKTRRQAMKQTGQESVKVNSEVFSPPTKTAASSSINRNGSMFSSDEPILSRLGVTQNRLPRGRKGIRSRRQTNVEVVKPDTGLMSVKTRSKVGRVCTSNDPVETVFRTPTNTRIEPLSCTFDEDFYEKVFINVRTNLSCHLDGKLGNDLDASRPQSPPPLLPAIRSTVVKSPHVVESEVHTATSLAALTAFPTLLTAEQYGCDFGTAKIKRPITKHSWKWKWDSVKKYKYVNEGGKIVKKIKQPMLGLRDLSKLDMWTQLTMRQKHEVARKQAESMTSSNSCLVDSGENSREEKQRQIDQLNMILDSRRLPEIVLEQNEQTIIKLEITDEGFRYLAGELSASSICEGPSTSLAVDRIIPANLNLIPSRSLGESLRHTVVLSGEWARPRCYVCFGCGARFDKLKALEEHKMFRHPHVYSTHYEIVGRELIEGNLYKHFFIPLKALSRHREYAQGILVNKKTEDHVSKSSSNSGNEEESLDSLHSVTASFTTVSSSKLSDDCDTDTKTAIENVSTTLSFTEPSTKNDDSPAVASNSSVDCTKCSRNCHGMLELYRHMLDCSGDYAWILAKKKKYRYYGSRKRRQFNKQNSTLHLHKRKIKETKDENESDETPKKKPNMSPSTPRPRPSDADSIRKMLENLPPKRVCREIIPNATKPRLRKFKTTAARKMQQNPINKCKTSNTTLTAISKKLLRNHKLRAITEKDKKISRNSKLLENKRKSARVKGAMIVNKKAQTNNKANKKTETTKGGIVRKIGATTKRFVKKIHKRLIGEKKAATTGNDPEKITEKKPSKLSAVRKLTFDKEQNETKPPEESKEDKSLVVEKQTVSSEAEVENKCEKSECSKGEIPTITIETDTESKKVQDTAINETPSLISEGSMENLDQQQCELSTSTEDLRRIPTGILQNQVSPTTKRRSKKINDCIAMLTGKLQEKLGKPFLECKAAVSDGGTKMQNSTESSTVTPSNESKDTKLPKRKAFSRRIVKCDQPSEPCASVIVPPPAVEPAVITLVTKEPQRVEPLVVQPLVKEPAMIESPMKRLPIIEPPVVANSPRKQPSIPKSTLAKPSIAESPITTAPKPQVPHSKPFIETRQPQHTHPEPPMLLKPPIIECPPKMGSQMANNIQAAFNQFLPVPVKKTSPPVAVATKHVPAPVIFKETPRKAPTERKPQAKQQCIVNADTIRVPCIKPTQLTIPQFNPVPIPAPRGMITKRRQTIAGAPNDFLTEINSPRCALPYNNLPFELEVPLDLSKKPKRTSPKVKSNPKAAFPLHLPQISVKPNSVLMPPMPFALPILPQTQIIPILCEQMQTKVPQMTLQNPPLVFPQEPVKPSTNVPRKRATNNKKPEQTNITPNVNLLSINLVVDTPPPKKVSKKTDEKLKVNLVVPPVKNSMLIRDLMAPLPTQAVVDPPKLYEEITVNKPESKDQSSSMEVVKQQTLQPAPIEKINVEVINIVPAADASTLKELSTVQPPTLDITKEKPAPQVPTIIEAKESKDSTKTNKKATPVTPKKSVPPSLNTSTPNSPDNNLPTAPIVSKVENKGESSPESQKSLPTRRSRRNKAAVANQSDPPPPVTDVPPSALKEVEEIAASFLSEDEQEVDEDECTKTQSQTEEVNPKEDTTTNTKSDEAPKAKKEVEVEVKATDSSPTEKPKTDEKDTKTSSPAEDIPIPVTNNKDTSTPANQDSSKKPRRRRKNELAAIVADQLLESFKEVDKSRLDDLKKLENLAYEKSEDLLLTGMRLMPTTKRKNALDNKKEISVEQESKGIPSKEGRKTKADVTKEKTTKTPKDDTEVLKDPKDIPKVDVKAKNQKDVDVVKPTTVSCKEDYRPKPLPIDFGNYRTNSMDSWSHRTPSQQNLVLLSPENEKSPSNEVPGAVHKKNKKKQMKKRDKKIEIENINRLRTGLESFTFSKDVVDAVKEDVQTRNTEPPTLSIAGLFTPTQRNSAGAAVNKEPEVSNFGSLTSVKGSSSILRPSILAASLDIATNKENPTQQNERKQSISSRDPRLNKNIHTEETDQPSVPPETTSRLATLRQRRKSLADVNPPTNTGRMSSRSAANKRSDVNSRRNSLAFDDDEDDNYLTAIAKRVNDKIMSAEDKDFNLANDGFELATSFLDMDDPFGRPSTSMSVRSAPNFNDDRSNMDTMDATNTDLIDMDVDDDMSVYTTFSQDTTRSKGRRRRRRRSVLLTRKPKKTNINTMEPTETFDCLLCNKKFAKPAALNKHQLTIAHVSKVSEQEYLNATRKQEEAKQAPSIEASTVKTTTTTPAPTTPVPESPKPAFNAIQSMRLEETIVTPAKVTEVQEKPPEKVEKPTHQKLPYIPPNSILNQSGIEPISSPEQNYERYSTKTSSRLTLNPDERLFYECCNILKGSETPLVERTYPIVPPTTYAYDLQVKPVTPKSTNERYSYIKQSTADASGKREGGTYPRLDINQFSDISSDSNPACAQPPPILPVNYAQMHVLSAAKDQAVLPNDEGDGGALRSNVPRENPVLQMASLASPNPVAPLTARTFVNQPSQIGTHLHGMESAATVTQKQNFISPLHSASSQSSTITTTTCRLKTKAAMKGYDNLKVSIPTVGLDMEHALERSPRPGCKLTTLAEIALGNETPMTALTTFTPAMQMHNDQKSKCKLKSNDLAEQFPTLLGQTKQDQTPPQKKRDKSPIKESSPIISVHDTESCMPIVLNLPKKPECMIPKDIYEFDDSENTPISKAIQSPFKIADDNDGSQKKPIIIPERPFKNIGMEEQEGIKFQKPETPAVNDDNTTSTVTYSDRDDFVYGSISGGDEDNDNDNDNDNDDNKDGNINSAESSNSSAFTAKTFENKSLIMGRIFKNAKTKPKIIVEKPKLPTPEPPKQIPKQELDRLFDTLRGLNENRQAIAAKEERQETAANSSARNRESQTAKRRTPAATKATKSKANTNKPNKKAAKKDEHCSKEIAQLHAELGMSPAEIAELIGEGQRKSQRRCAVNRPKKLVEIWSSDEFEEFLSTKDIIALIEEKEQKTKKKRKTSTTGTKKVNPQQSAASSNNDTKSVEDQKPITKRLQSENEKAKNITQKTLRNNANAAQTSKAATIDNAKNIKPTKAKRRLPTATANVMPPPPSKTTTPKAQKETKSAASSRQNSTDDLKSNSPRFKKPTQRNIISKSAADDSESDFEAELRRNARGGPIRNRRKTISGKLENDAGSSSNCTKKESAKSKPVSESAVPRNSSKTLSSSADSHVRPQARRKRIASEMLYYWSSSSDEEFGRIETAHDDEDHIDESENYQQHGWIVGDSHKKLVTLLAIAKGNKKVDDCGVKEINSSKKKS